jgi:hypothetical protein
MKFFPFYICSSPKLTLMRGYRGHPGLLNKHLRFQNKQSVHRNHVNKLSIPTQNRNLVKEDVPEFDVAETIHNTSGNIFFEIFEVLPEYLLNFTDVEVIILNI